MPLYFIDCKNSDADMLTSENFIPEILPLSISGVIIFSSAREIAAPLKIISSRIFLEPASVFN